MKFSANLDEQFLRDLEAEARRRRWTWRIGFLKGPLLALFILAIVTLIVIFAPRPAGAISEPFSEIFPLGVLLIPFGVHGLFFIPRLFRFYRSTIAGFADGFPPRELAATGFREFYPLASSLRFMASMSRAFRYFHWSLFSDHDGMGIHVSMLELRTLFRIPWRSRAFESWLARQPKPVDFDAFLAHYQRALDAICGPFTPELPPYPDLSRPIPIQSDTSPILALMPLAQIAGMKIDSLSDHPRWAPMFGADGLSFDLTQLNRRKTIETVEQISDIHTKILGVSRPPFILSSNQQRRVNESLAAAGLPAKWPSRICCRIHKNGEWTDYNPISDVELMQFVNAFLFFFYRTPWRWELFDHEYKLLTDDARVVPVRVTFEPDRELRVNSLQ